MRLWSLHPSHLDRVGLLAWWRESLLAQAVLAGRTKGYRQHPQLERFRACQDPVATIGAYLTVLAQHAAMRGYRFDATRIVDPAGQPHPLEVTSGQLAYEWGHLGRKLEARSPADAERWRGDAPSPHPLFVVTPGEVASWERR